MLFKHKHFRDTTQTKLTSNSSKLTGASREAAIDLDGQAQDASKATIVLREEDNDDDVVALHDIPTIDEGPADPPLAARPAKRRRGRGSALPKDGDGTHANAAIPDSDDDDDDGLFVADEESDGSKGAPPAKRHKEATIPDEDQRDDKKKLAMNISYEGFSIYGRVLCLVVKKRDAGISAGRNTSAKAGRGKAGQSAAPGGQAVMENWITSTQIPEAVSDEVLNAS